MRATGRGPTALFPPPQLPTLQSIAPSDPIQIQHVEPKGATLPMA